MAEDNVNPAHYKSDPSGVECIEITRHRDFAIGSAIKYLWRAGLKRDASLSDVEKEIEDLEKAKWYIDDKIASLQKSVSSRAALYAERPEAPATAIVA